MNGIIIYSNQKNIQKGCGNIKKEIIIERINIIDKLKKAEEQIQKGEVIDADVVFSEMRQKYGYQ